MAENQQLGLRRSQNYNNPPPATTTGLPVVSSSPSPSPHQHQQTSTYTSTTSVINIEINKPPSPEPEVVVQEHYSYTGIIVTKRWTCCGMGIGWFLFVLGWFLCGIPWYVGFFMLICGRFDRRELPGFLACATFAIVVSVVATVQAINKKHH